jgi:hypothetical protein
MNRPMLRKAVPFALALVSVFTLAGARAMQQDPSAQAGSQAGGQRTDGQIEMDVVHALDRSDALKNDLITAATVQGEVTLSGTVSSDASRQLAESIASHVQGVAKVTNNLKVGDPQEAAAAANDATPPVDDSQTDNQGSAAVSRSGPAAGTAGAPAAAAASVWSGLPSPAASRLPVSAAALCAAALSTAAAGAAVHASKGPCDGSPGNADPSAHL